MGYLVTLLTVVVMAMAVVRLTEGQPQCASQLVPCAAYLNSTTRPPATCCDPIKQAVANDLPCLCNLYRDPSFLGSIGINVTQALLLPTLCGLNPNDSACDNATAPTSSHGSPSGPGHQGSNGAKIASAGIFSFLLIAVSTMFF